MTTVPTPGSRARHAAGRPRFNGPDKRSIAGMTVVIVVLNVVGWGVLALFVAPAHYRLGSAGVFGIGLGLTAYLLGMRHAFDADHIAAIDNTTRRLLADRKDQGRRPMSVGFFFSLGHSTVVFVLVLLLTVGIQAVAGQLSAEDSPLKNIGGVVGTSVSGLFLLIIGVMNLVI